MAAVVDLEGQPCSSVNVVVEQVHILHALVVDKGSSDDAREFILLSESAGHQDGTVTKAVIKSRLGDISPSEQG
jgi:hypothetical protein